MYIKTIWYLHVYLDVSVKQIPKPLNENVENEHRLISQIL